MSNSTELPVMIRDVEKGDGPFIFDSWKRTCRKSRRMDDVGDGSFNFGQHKILEDILARGVVYVACYPEDPSFILGYICGEYMDKCNVVHMTLVKSKTSKGDSWQNMGIGTMLFKHFLDFRPNAREGDDQLPLYYTHSTKLTNQRSKSELKYIGKLREGGQGIKEGQGWLRDKLRELGAKYDPFIAYLTHAQLGIEKPKKYRCPKCGHTSHRSYK